MAVPTTRQEFRDYCLRRLGAPVLKIQVDDDQIDDRIDEALKYYYDYHYDGSDRIYFKYQITDQDKANGYITMPENIIGVINIFSIGYGSYTGDMFSLQYQIALNDMYTLTSQSMVPYYTMMYGLQQMEQLLVGMKPIRYNRHKNKLYIDTNWDNFATGSWIIAEAYEVVDPEVYTSAWADRWLQRYTCALIKQQWGTNLTKFVGLQLPGGVQFNGDRILSDAQAEIAQIESEMINSYSTPPMDMIG